MSVQIIETEVFNEVYRKMVDYTFRREVDINYCGVFARHTEEQLREFVLILCNLNDESFCKKYYPEKPVNMTEFKELDFSFEIPKINTYQMLKHLHCISYNIEVCTIERELTDLEGNVMKKLRLAIDEISLAILNTVPEYKVAKWNEN